MSNESPPHKDVWVSQVGQVIVARIRGDLAENSLLNLSSEIAELARASNTSLLLVDALEMNPPKAEVPILQWKINDEQKELHLRRAIVVPNTKMAYLARLAFGDAVHKVFYNDLAAAMNWLLGQSLR